MQEIKELTSIVSRKKLMKLSILGQNDDSMLDQLYQLVASGEVQSNQEAAEKLYGADEHLPAYQKLKSKLKGRLIDMLLLIDNDMEVGKDAPLAFRKTRQQWLQICLLFSNGALKSGLRKAEEVLELAIKFEQIDFVMLICQKLCEIYATQVGDETKYNYYRELADEYQQITYVVSEVEYAYTQLRCHYIGQIPDPQDIAKIGKTLFEEVKSYLTQYDIIAVHWFARYIQVTYLLAARKHQEVINACQLMLDLLKMKSSISAKSVNMMFYMYQLVCYTELREFDKGKAVLDKARYTLGNQFGRSYFQLIELGLVLFLHSQRYQEAYEFMIERELKTTTHKHNKFMLENSKVYDAYIHYLIYLNKITPVAASAKTKTFRLGRFMNEVPIYSKDKKGMNIPIMILQTLFSIATGKYDQVFDRIEAIQKYASRYIRKEDHFRSNCFIKMLLQIPISGFQPREANRLAERYLEQLATRPLNEANQSREIEIIPYEDLWQMALASIR